MAQLQKGTTYITGDQVTAANLNALVDSGILTPGAVTDQTAKTVPLAADTILLHSAADTALRKTTMTQLFATPQPLGATTPSSVAATTGTFSSTLGVTGVATLGNGAILGTPASGTVTNLTGTASININGTVGATTPSTVAATTVGATGIISSTSNNPSAEFGKGNGTAASVRLNPHTATYHNWSIDNGVTSSGTLNIAPSTAVGGNTYTTPVAYFTTTGLNSTAIGATTPSTGVFTTLKASGMAVNATPSSLGTTQNWLQFANTGGDLYFGQESSVAAAFFSGSSAYATVIYSPQPVQTIIGGTKRLDVTSTGAAITGTLSATNVVKSTVASSTAWQFAGQAGSGTPTALAASATYQLASGSGLLMVHNDDTGSLGVFICWAGSVTKIAGPAEMVSGTPAASQIGVSWSGSYYTITNGFTTTQNLYFTTILTRPSN